MSENVNKYFFEGTSASVVIIIAGLQTLDNLSNLG